MIGVSQIQFGEDTGGVEGAESRNNQGKWILVFDCDFIYSGVIYTWAQGFVLLFYEEKSCPHRRRGGVNKTGCHRVRNVFFHGLTLGHGQVEKPLGGKGGAR